jgi:hypothetical protein
MRAPAGWLAPAPGRAQSEISRRLIGALICARALGWIPTRARELLAVTGSNCRRPNQNKRILCIGVPFSVLNLLYHRAGDCQASVTSALD